MKISRRSTLALGTALAASVCFGTAQAAETMVNVSLWDKGETSMEMLGKIPPLGMAMSPGADMSMATMGITADKTTVPAGAVTFVVTNDSKTDIHEMVVSPVADINTALPYDKDRMKVDEDAAGHLAEVAELEPGQSGTLTINMKPGIYILYCNIPGHYELGMWTLLTVTE